MKKKKRKAKMLCMHCGKRSSTPYCSQKCKKVSTQLPAGPCAYCFRLAPKNKLWCSPACEVAWEKDVMADAMRSKRR